MRKASSIMRCSLLAGFFLLVTLFSFASSAAAHDQAFPGNEVNTLGNEDLAKATSENNDEEEKFKFLPPKPILKKPFFKKPIPVVKPIVPPKPFFKKPLSIPFVKKPFPKPFVPKPIPFEKKPFPIPKKPFLPPLDTEEFLKPKPFFKKPIPKLPFPPKFKKPLLPPLPHP